MLSQQIHYYDAVGIKSWLTLLGAGALVLLIAAALVWWFVRRR